MMQLLVSAFLILRTSTVPLGDKWEPLLTYYSYGLLGTDLDWSLSQHSQTALSKNETSVKLQTEKHATRQEWKAVYWPTKILPQPQKSQRSTLMQCCSEGATLWHAGGKEGAAKPLSHFSTSPVSKNCQDSKPQYLAEQQTGLILQQQLFNISAVLHV